MQQALILEHEQRVIQIQKKLTKVCLLLRKHIKAECELDDRRKEAH